jgi:hypothetical protein
MGFLRSLNPPHSYNFQEKALRLANNAYILLYLVILIDFQSPLRHQSPKYTRQ